jgi:hypothetical protein
MGTIINAVINGQIDKGLKALHPPRGDCRDIGVS